MQTPPMQPFKDLVLIEADTPKTQTKTGLLIQEAWKTLPPVGTVLAIGPEVTEVKVGDRVIFERYGAIKGYTDTTDKATENHRICKASHLIAKIEGNGKTD
jgi:co-chaperonin GroES (HSP10)